MKRHRAQKPGERPGAAAVTCRIARACAATQHGDRQSRERRRGAVGIILERREIGRRFVVEVTFADVDQTIDLGAFEAAGGDLGGKRLADIVRRRGRTARTGSDRGRGA